MSFSLEFARHWIPFTGPKGVINISPLLEELVGQTSRCRSEVTCNIENAFLGKPGVSIKRIVYSPIVPLLLDMFMGRKDPTSEV